MMKNNSKQLLIKYLQTLSQRFSFSAKIQFFIIGIASTVWFLMRVIPKPSRAGYPCVRAAAPVASAFILYILSLASSVVIFKRISEYLKTGKIQLTALFLVLGLAASVMSLVNNDSPIYAKAVALEAANSPMGIAKGINPGRVVWVYNPDATNASCTNAYDDGYFIDANTNQNEVDRMLEDALIKLTGQTTAAGAWDAIFKYHNQTRGKGSVTYTSSESIFIKINATSTWYENINSSFERVNNGYYAISETSPQVILAVLRQLVNTVGVPEAKIYVGDPLKHIYQDNYTKWHNEFPNVHYLDYNSSNLGREKVVKSSTAIVKYSDRGEVLKTASGNVVYQDSLYSIFETMEYMINIPTLKAHEYAGTTMFGKNHFGSQTRSDASHLHSGLVSTGTSLRNTYGQYRVQVDLMTHKLLGKKNLFYLMDALYCSDKSVTKPSKWQFAPFNNDWTSSLFLSQDPVAIESVGFDFLYAQYDGSDGKNSYPHLGAVDDYLHQLADSTQWPAGITYDPENDGTAIGYSQGVHEHWNNATEKKYSRNLGSGYGIELIQDFMSVETIPVTGVTISPVNLTLVSGTNSALTGTISPANATNLEVNWSSSNSSIATVSNRGEVTAVAAGTATITITTADGGKTATCAVSVESAVVPSTVVYIDFGPDDGTNGNITSSPDLNGNYWNNITNTSTSASAVNLVDNNNSSTGAFIKITSGFSSNGIKNGGLLSPEASLLSDFAINTATQDYFYTQTSSSFTVGGLDKTKSYVFSMFGTRNDTETRTTTYTLQGSNTYSGILQTSGTNLGGTGYNGNTKTILTSESVTPNSNGQISVTVTKTAGSYGYLGVMKIKKTEGASVVPVTGITLNATSLSLTAGETSALTAIVSPSNATNQSVSWSSNNTSIATVSSSGIVTAVAVGSTTITVTTADGSKTDTCIVTVAVLKNLALNKTTTSSSDESATLTANFATDGDYGSRWSSAFSDPQWIFVDLGNTYNVTRVKLFWEAAYGSSYKIQVSTDASAWTDVYSTTSGDGATDDLSISDAKGRFVRMYGTARGTEYGHSLYEFEVYGENLDAQPPSTPAGLNSLSQTLTTISLEWETSTDNVGVTGYDIYINGTYAASTTSTSYTIGNLVAGTTYSITIKAKDTAGNCSAASSALTLSTLTIPVTGVTLSSSSLSLTVGSTSALVATVLPLNATNQSLSWTSGNTSIASISSSGLVTVVGAGTTTITVITVDGSKMAICAISVTVPVTGITLSPTSLSLTPGQTSALTATISPSNATDKSISWTSGNTSVATVNANGAVTAIAAGTTIITVTTQDGNKSAACNVNVIIPVTGVKLSPSSLSLTPGETSALTASILPSNATDKTVNWTSSNTAVATVDVNGMVTAVGVGNTIVTAITLDGSNTASCKVAVAVPVTGVAVDTSSLLLLPGESFELTATISPSDATNQTIIWLSDNSGVVTVDTSGYITAVDLGTATIMVITQHGNKKDSCKVTVTDIIPVTEITLTPTSISMILGEVYTLTATISPANATNKNVTWLSGDNNVATVSNSGLVTAITEGSTTITVTSADGDKTASCSVNVSATIPITGLALNASFLSIAACQTSSLTATVSPSDANNKTVLWSSDNTSVATVDAAGVIKGIASGIANITATSEDGGLTASCEVIVTSQTLNEISAGVSGTITCKNSSVTLSSLSGTSYANYQWSGPNSFSSTAKSPSVSAPGIYTLTATDTVNNCIVTAITNVLQNTLKPDAMASSNGTLSCGTKTVSLKVTTSSANTVVTWDGQAVGVNPVSVVWPGKYFVTTKDTLNGCVKRDSVTVNQYITYNPSQFYNNTFSTYSNGTIADNNTNGWILDRSKISGVTSTYVSNTTPKFFAIYSKRITAQKLGAEGIWMSKVINVSGKPNFQIGVKISTEGTFTSSDYVKLYYKLDGGSEIPWDSRTGSLGTVDFRSPLLNANTVQIIVKLYTTIKATSVVSNQYIEQYQLYIQDCGYPLVVYSSASGVINCANPSVTLQANSSHAGATYKWSGPNSYTSTSQYPVISVPGTYTVTASMPTTTNPSVTSSVATGTVTVSQNLTTPGASIVIPDTISFQKKYVTLYGNSPTSGVYYSWTGPNSFVSSQQNTLVTAKGAYNLTVKNPANGCTTKAIVNVLSDTVPSVDVVTYYELTYSEDDAGTNLLTVANSENISLSDFLTEPTTGLYLKGIPILLTEASSGELGMKVLAYPNPFSEFTNIEFSSIHDNHATIEIYSVNGCQWKIFDGDILTSQLYKVMVDGTKISAGTYYYVIRTNDHDYSGKLLLVK